MDTGKDSDSLKYLHSSKNLPISSDQSLDTQVEIKQEPDENCDTALQYQFLDFGQQNDDDSEHSHGDDDNDHDDSHAEDDIEQNNSIEDDDTTLHRSALHPTEDSVQKHDFFGAFGLVKKSEVPVTDPHDSRLHRNRGGKLRRTIKPKIHVDMLSYATKSKPAAKSVKRHTALKPVKHFQKSLPQQLSGARLSEARLSPATVETAASAVKQEPEDQASDNQEKEDSSNEEEQGAAEKIKANLEVEKMMVALAPALHPQLMTSVARSPMRTLAKMSEIKNREKKGLPIDSLLKQVERLNKKGKGMTKPLYETVSRRSSRLRGRPKNWKHLLKVACTSYGRGCVVRRHACTPGYVRMYMYGSSAAADISYKMRFARNVEKFITCTYKAVMYKLVIR